MVITGVILFDRFPDKGTATTTRHDGTGSSYSCSARSTKYNLGAAIPATATLGYIFAPSRETPIAYVYAYPLIRPRELSTENGREGWIIMTAGVDFGLDTHFSSCTFNLFKSQNFSIQIYAEPTHSSSFDQASFSCPYAVSIPLRRLRQTLALHPATAHLSASCRTRARSEA
jgi:hypothetical protein